MGAFWNKDSEFDAAEYIQQYDVSPFGALASTEDMFDGRTKLVAHRGLVDLQQGIPENSWASVENALNFQVNNVELDVQTTRDGIPIGFHDDTTNRTLGFGGKVTEIHSADLLNKPLKILDPNSMLLDPANPKYYDTPSVVESVPTIMKKAFAKQPDASIFLDAKTESAAQASIRTLLDNPEMIPKAAVKVYPGLWGNATGMASRLAARREPLRSSIACSTSVSCR